MPTKTRKHKARVIDDPWPTTAPGLFKAACTCGESLGPSRTVREDAERDVQRHMDEVAG